MDSMLRKLGLKEGEAIIHPWINKALEKAQQKVEARNFDIRKNLLRFDDVMNDQRKVIYEQRIELMRAEDVAEDVADMRREVVETLCVRHVPEKAYAEQWETESLRSEVQRVFDLDLPIGAWAAEEGIGPVEIKERLEQEVDRKLAEKAGQLRPRPLAHGGKEHTSPIARPALERAPACPRSPTAGNWPQGLWAARSSQRI